jgi:hypothetical protein
MHVKHVQSVTRLVNHLGIAKLRAIAKKTARKCENDEFYDMALNYV